MPNHNFTNEIILTAGGGTSQLDTRSSATIYFITGSVTLAASWTISSTGTAYKGQEFRLKYTGNINLGGNTITIFGQTVDSVLAGKDFEIRAIYNGATWDVNFIEPYTALTTTTDLTVTGDLTIANDGLFGASNTAGSVWVADGTNFNAVVLSGDATLHPSGSLSLKNAVVKTPSTSGAGAYTVLLTDYMIHKTGITGGGDTVTLPSGAANGQIFRILDKSGTAGTNNITVATAGSETVNGSASTVISSHYGYVSVQFDGANYFIIG